MLNTTYSRKEELQENSEWQGGVIPDLDNEEGLLDIFDGNLLQISI